jgi:hypothetical protein
MDAFRVVINGYGELALGRLLADYILIQKIFDFERLGNFVRTRGGRLGLVIFQNGIADSNAFVADVGPGVIARGGNQFPNNILTFMAEGTSKSVIGASALQ